MTKTALANKELALKEEIARKDRESRQTIAAKDRQSKEDIDRANRALTKSEGKKNRIQKYVDSGAKLGGTILKAFVNDPIFYKQYVKDLDQFFNVPTFDRLGKWDMGGKLYSSPSKTSAVAGILILPWIPTVGPQIHGATTFGSNPINQILTRSKEKVLALNSRSSVNWEASDLGYNFICSSDIRTMLEEFKRVILVYRTYHNSNAYLAEHLITALGWNFSDIVVNYAEYRKTYVIYAKRFNSAIVAPKALSLFDRRAFLASNIFCDSRDRKYPRQMYAYRQSVMYTLSLDGSECEANSTAPMKASLVAFRAAMDLAFSRIVENPDFVEMYQDLRHAFGSKLVQLEEDITGETVVFNDYDLNRLQLHNAKSLPTFINANGALSVNINYTQWPIKQDSSGYLFQGTGNGNDGERNCGLTLPDNATATAFVQWCSKYLNDSEYSIYNIFEPTASGDTILDITRLDYRAYVSVNSDIAQFDITSCGTEILEQPRLFALEYDFGTQSYALTLDRFGTYTMVDRNSAAATRILARLLGFMSNFDWHPIMHINAYVSSTNYIVTTIMDACTTFPMLGTTLYDLHTACVLSEYYLPDLEFSR